MKRRRFLATTLAGGAVTATAGCLADENSASSPKQSGAKDSESDSTTANSALFTRVELVDTEIVASIDTEMATDVDVIDVVPPSGEPEQTNWHGGNTLKVELTDSVGQVQRPPGEYTLQAVTEFDELVAEHTITLDRSLTVEEIGTYRQLGAQKEDPEEELASCRVTIKNEGPMPVSAFQASFADPDTETPIGRTQHGTAVLAGETVTITHSNLFGFRTSSSAESNRGTVDKDYVITFHDGTQFRIPVTLKYEGDVEYHSSGFITEFYFFNEMAVVRRE
ncbi:hypothetical protein SAMN04489841_2878 [Natrinema salaciae]|uniref:Uncharacterized protein n=2 Tax=Natrinema salaciae TaxID=1186196 RepID=A0A1H9KC73_9EURY|nr:hypothetical protein SAMN04489841_2878 [Natrinema salaciae]